MKTAIALLIFNRPNHTEQVFEAIRQAQPPVLLVVADGPRSNQPGEAEKCVKARAVIDRVDWKCKVLTNYSDVNLGCKKRVSSGLDWVFNIVEEAIILEDDCLPDPSFFSYCEDLLKYYKDDERIMAICGQNVYPNRDSNKYSYYFSRYFHCWGWATWRRAWHHYDSTMYRWKQIRDSSFLNDILGDSRAVKYWTKFFDLTYKGHINSWDYQWVFACWIQSGLSILPNINLISNIGTGADATHTTSSLHANMPTQSFSFPLSHPSFVIRDAIVDESIQNKSFNPSIVLRAKNKIKSIFVSLISR